MAKVFYSASKKHEVFDGEEKYDTATLQDILPADKKAGDYQMVTLAPEEVQQIDGSGNLTKLDPRPAKDAEILERKKNKDAAVAELKFLGLSTDSIKALTNVDRSEIEAAEPKDPKAPKAPKP